MSMTDVADCLAALRHAADRLGHSPTIAEYDTLGLVPSSGTIMSVCGSWDDAKRQAGLDEYGRGSRSTYSREACAEAIREVARRVDGPLSAPAYDAARDASHPHSQTIEHRFDSFAAFRDNVLISACPECDATNLYERLSNPRYRCYSCGSTFSRPTIRASKVAPNKITVDQRDRALQAAAESCGEPLGVDEYDTWRAEQDDNHPSKSAISQRWGWANACDAAGVEPQRRPLTIERYTNAITRMYDETGEWPTMTRYETLRTHSEPRATEMYKKDNFPDSWQEMLTIAREKLDG